MPQSQQRILVKEKIADAGVELLRQHFDVDEGNAWTDDQLAAKISNYDGIIIRSATNLNAALLDSASKLKVIARAGIGVDNVDVETATKLGIIVVNAPQSNIIAAAEHTMALMLSLARQIPQADASLKGGKWERGRFSGVEIYEKTLGILGFGRIGQLVAARAKSFGMEVIAFDPYVSTERFRELGVGMVKTPDELYSEADFITLHLARTEETEGFLDAEAFSKMKDGVRIINCARGQLIVDEALEEALNSGKVGGAALDVFRKEPNTEHPLFDHENVVVTPHLGASTAEAQDRAGIQAAEQVVAALSGGVVATAVNIPSVSPEDREVLGPYLPLCERLGRLCVALAAGSNLDRLEFEYIGRIAQRDTRLLTVAGLHGLLSGHTEESVNYVNAPAIAAERGIQVSEVREPHAQDYSDLVRVTAVAGGERVRVVGTTIGQRHRPHLLEAWGQRFNVQIDDPFIALFRYEDKPGMVGRVGAAFGDHAINISSAAVGRQPPLADQSDCAVMVVTSANPIGQKVVDEILEADDFMAGCAVNLNG